MESTKKLSQFLLLAVVCSQISGQSLQKHLKPSSVFNYPISNNPNDIHFYLHTDHGNAEQEIIFNNSQSLDNSLFNPQLKTVLLIHGYTNNGSTGINRVVLPAYLESNLTYNFISVDWGMLSGSTPFSSPVEEVFIYAQVVNVSVALVGNRTAQFLKFLNISGSAVHIVGHSLGAHISGIAANLYQVNNGGEQIARVSGLDPAGPLFQKIFPFSKLNSSDAAFVDVIHTNRGQLGLNAVEGHVDFYPNGGSIQPGCSDTLNFIESDVCSHGFSLTLYAASITKNITSCLCTSMSTNWLFGTTTVTVLTESELTTCLSDCTTGTVLLGEPCPSTAQGLYSLTTTATP